MDTRLCLALLTYTLAFCGNIVSGVESSLDLLTHNLFSDYNKNSIPDIGGVNVSHSMTIIRVVSLEDDVLTLDVWINLGWKDQRLRWDPKKYGGIDQIWIPSNLIWKPDITLFYSASPFDSYPGHDVNAIITDDGSVSLVPQMKLHSYCPVKDKAGKDSQRVTCHMTFGSWTYHRQMLDLYDKIDSVDTNDVIPNPSLKLRSGSVKREVKTYACCPEEYVSLIYTLNLKYKKDKK